MATMFESEQELVATLDLFDQLVCRVLSGDLPFREFESQYDTFYVRYALDGHESDRAERALFEAYEERIALHREIWEEVLTRLCSDVDARKEAYVAAGRFGPDTATRILRELTKRHGLAC